MKNPKPHLADVQCANFQFAPGTRLLVKVFKADRERRKKLKKMVEKWAGDHVEVLVIDISELNLEVIPPTIIKE